MTRSPHVRRSIVPVLILAALSDAAHGFEGCRLSPGPVVWFFSRVVIEPQSLPPGVVAKYSRIAEGSAGEVLIFANSSATPFYLVSHVEPPLPWSHAVPPDSVPRFVLANGAAYALEGGGTWRTLAAIPDGAGRISLLELLDQGTLEAVRGTTGAGQAATAEPPPARIEIELHADGKSFVLGGTLGYALNPRYGERDEAQFSLATFTPDPVSLPAGVVIERRTDLGDRATALESYVLGNQGRGVVYVLARFKGELDWRQVLPEGYVPLAKYVSGRTFMPASTYPDTPAPRTYWEDFGIEPAFMSGDLGKFAPDVHLQYGSGPGRPRDFHVPPDQPFTFVAYYGAQRIEVRARVVYVANPDYDAQSKARIAAGWK